MGAPLGTNVAQQYYQHVQYVKRDSELNPAPETSQLQFGPLLSLANVIDTPFHLQFIPLQATWLRAGRMRMGPSL